MALKDHYKLLLNIFLILRSDKNYFFKSINPLQYSVKKQGLNDTKNTLENSFNKKNKDQ